MNARTTFPIRCCELFVGAGGLSLGLRNAGLEHVLSIESDPVACMSFRRNISHFTGNEVAHQLLEADVRDVSFGRYSNVGIDLVAGGPPCQPFSIGGKHKAYRDERDLFPSAIEAVRKLNPRIFVFENVRGLVRPSFERYFSYLMLQLRYTRLKRRTRESWSDHCARLQKYDNQAKSQADYIVRSALLNAADYGVPQKRERVFIVGFRSDLNQEWVVPKPTHSRELLLYEKFVSKSYWKKYSLSEESPSYLEKEELHRFQLNEDTNSQHLLRRWQTTRDAINDLPVPSRSEHIDDFNHVLRTGAKLYEGHIGSKLDEPSKTIKAGKHGVPGGENMFIDDRQRLRYFTVREAARLQTFPDSYVFAGTWTQTMKQIGNAVPIVLANTVAKSVVSQLL